MNRRVLFCLLALLVLPTALKAKNVAPLREGWQLQSACKFQAAGESIAAEGFSVEGWLKIVVPSTVLAAQAAAGAVPDPYFGMNLRQIPGSEYPIGQVFAKTQ
jgi:exo-1,4-beta-D-glucosaminidase